MKIDKSLSNRKWIGPSSQQERLAYRLVQQYGISQLTALLSVKRGVVSDDLESYLLPKLKNLMPNPYVLQDMQIGADRLLMAVTKKERICIFADYDVDGTVSASMLFIWLRFFNIIPTVYIPDRIKDGYGPNEKIIKELNDKNVSLIITVDCGANASDMLKSHSKIDFIILDHHQANEISDKYYAHVNPNRVDDISGLHYLSAAGVVFLTLVSIEFSTIKICMSLSIFFNGFSIKSFE